MNLVLHRADLRCAEPPIPDLCDRNPCGCYHKYFIGQGISGLVLHFYNLDFSSIECCGNVLIPEAFNLYNVSHVDPQNPLKYYMTPGGTLEYKPTLRKWLLIDTDNDHHWTIGDNPYGLWSYGTTCEAIGQPKIIVGSLYSQENIPGFYQVCPDLPEEGYSQFTDTVPPGEIPYHKIFPTIKHADCTDWEQCSLHFQVHYDENNNRYRLLKSWLHQYETHPCTLYLRYAQAECCAYPPNLTEVKCLQEEIDLECPAELIVKHIRQGHDGTRVYEFPPGSGNYPLDNYTCETDPNCQDDTYLPAPIEETDYPF